jgi:hypothetical protein
MLRDIHHFPNKKTDFKQNITLKGPPFEMDLALDGMYGYF